MEFDKTQDPPIFKADFDRVMLELKQQRDEASEQRREMKRVLDELIVSRAEVDRLQMASKQTPERAQVDFHYQHVLKEMLNNKEEAKMERDSAKEEATRERVSAKEEAKLERDSAKEEATRERDRFEERLDKLQEHHRQREEAMWNREEARQKELRQTKEEARQREEATVSREEARRKEAKEEARVLREEAKEEARALRKEVVELMEKAQKNEILNLSEMFLVKKREVRSPKGHPPHNDSEHKIHTNEHQIELPNTNQSKVRLGLPLDDKDDDDIEQIGNIEYLDNDSDNDERHTEQQLSQGQGEEEREILILPSTSIITRTTPTPSADEIDAWSPAVVVFKAVQEVIETWKSLAEEVYGERSNSSVQNLHHVRRVMAENEMAFKPALNICPNLPIIIAHMMVIHVGISVRTVSWTSKMTEWTEEVSRVICVAHLALFPRN